MIRTKSSIFSKYECVRFMSKRVVSNQEKIKDMLVKIHPQARLEKIQEVKSALTTACKEIKNLLMENPLEANLLNLFKVQLAIYYRDKPGQKPTPNGVRNYLEGALDKLKNTDSELDLLKDEIQSPLKKHLEAAVNKIDSISEQISGAELFLYSTFPRAPRYKKEILDKKAIEAKIENVKDTISLAKLFLEQSLSEKTDSLEQTTIDPLDIEAIKAKIENTKTTSSSAECYAERVLGLLSQTTDSSAAKESLAISALDLAQELLREEVLGDGEARLDTSYKAKLLADKNAILAYQSSTPDSRSKAIFDKTYSIALAGISDWINTDDDSNLQPDWLSGLICQDKEKITLENARLAEWYRPVEDGDPCLEKQCSERYSTFKDIYAKHQTVVGLHDNLYVMTQQLAEITTLEQLKETENFSAELGIGGYGPSTSLIIYPQ
jgi:hypothetical protein